MNEANKILLDFEIQTDIQSLARKSGLEMINLKKRVIELSV